MGIFVYIIDCFIVRVFHKILLRTSYRKDFTAYNTEFRAFLNNIYYNNIYYNNDYVHVVYSMIPSLILSEVFSCTHY